MRRMGFAAGAAALSVALSGCWFQVGNGAGRTFSNDETTITAANVGGLDVLWDTDLAGNRAPVSVNGTIYTSNGTKVFALNAATGAVKWEAGPYVLHGDIGDVTVAFFSPLYNDGKLLVPAATGVASFDSGAVYEFNPRTGELLSNTSNGLGSTYDLAVADGVVAKRKTDIGGSSGLGLTEIAWKFSPTIIHSGSGDTFPTGHAIVGERILWGQGPTAEGFSAACPPNPGFSGCAPDWTTPLGATTGGPAAIGDSQAVYADGSGTVSVLDAATGAIQWTGETASPVVSRPVVHQGTILVGTFDNRVVAFPAAGCDAATCDPLWTVDLGDVPNRGLVAAGEVAYAATNNGSLIAFASAGCGAATCPTLKTVDAHAEGGGLIVDAGRVLVPVTGGHLVAYGLPS